MGAVADAALGTRADIPDSRGTNLYREHPDLGALLRRHPGEPFLAQWQPRLDELRRRILEEFDDLALSADKPVPPLRQRTRRGEDLQSIDKHPAYRALERVAYGELGLAVMCMSSSFAVMVGFMSQVFPVALRYSAISLSYQLCAALAGGLTPLIGTVLAHRFVGQWWPLAVFYSLLSAITLFSIVWLARGAPAPRGDGEPARAAHKP